MLPSTLRLLLQLGPDLLLDLLCGALHRGFVIEHAGFFPLGDIDRENARYGASPNSTDPAGQNWRWETDVSAHGESR